MNECVLYVEDAEDHQFLLAEKRKMLKVLSWSLVDVIVSGCVFIVIVSSVLLFLVTNQYITYVLLVNRLIYR